MNGELSAAMLFLVVLGIPVLAIFAFIFFQRKAQLNAWNELAVRTGLKCESGKTPWAPIRVTGSYRGRVLILDTLTRGTGRNSKTYTRVVLEMNNSVPLRMFLTEENVFDRIGKWMGGEDIQLGDDTLDRRFKIKGEPVEEIVRLLASLDIRLKLVEVSSLKVEIEPGKVRAEKRGVAKKVEELEKVFELLSALAEGVDHIGNTSYEGSV